MCVKIQHKDTNLKWALILFRCDRRFLKEFCCLFELEANSSVHRLKSYKIVSPCACLHWLSYMQVYFVFQMVLQWIWSQVYLTLFPARKCPDSWLEIWIFSHKRWSAVGQILSRKEAFHALVLLVCNCCVWGLLCRAVEVTHLTAAHKLTQEKHKSAG